MKSRTLISFCHRPVLNPCDPCGAAAVCAFTCVVVTAMKHSLRTPGAYALASIRPSTAPVWRAIISSPLVGIPHAETRLLRREMHGPCPWLASGSTSIPSHAEASQMRWPVSGELSPMPTGKTSPAGPPLGLCVAAARGEGEPLEAADHAGQRADFFRGAIHEVVDGETRRRITA